VLTDVHTRLSEGHALYNTISHYIITVYEKQSKYKKSSKLIQHTLKTIQQQLDELDQLDMKNMNDEFQIDQDQLKRKSEEIRKTYYQVRRNILLHLSKGVDPKKIMNDLTQKLTLLEQRLLEQLSQNTDLILYINQELHMNVIESLQNERQVMEFYKEIITKLGPEEKLLTKNHYKMLMIFKHWYEFMYVKEYQTLKQRTEKDIKVLSGGGVLKDSSQVENLNELTSELEKVNNTVLTLVEQELTPVKTQMMDIQQQLSELTQLSKDMVRQKIDELHALKTEIQPKLKEYIKLMDELLSKQAKVFQELETYLYPEEFKRQGWTEKRNPELLLQLKDQMTTFQYKTNYIYPSISIKEMDDLLISVRRHYEQLDKDFWREYKKVTSYVAKAQDLMERSPHEPFYVRIWDSVSGEKYARLMEKEFELSGHAIGTDKDTALSSFRKRALITMVGIVGLTSLLFYLYKRGKLYLQKRKLRSKLQKIQPKLMWILIEPTEPSLTPRKNLKVYTRVIDVIQDVLRPSNKLTLTSFSSKSKLYGVKTYMSQDLLFTIQDILLKELQRKKYTTSTLARDALERTLKDPNIQVVHLPVVST
jgi:uncharacterized protein YukE